MGELVTIGVRGQGLSRGTEVECDGKCWKVDSTEVLGRPGSDGFVQGVHLERNADGGNCTVTVPKGVTVRLK